MIVRACFSLILVATALVQSGQCLDWFGCRAPWPCGRTYYGMQCGCLYWHEWFSHKPCCCDPCNQCGDFVGSCNPYVKNGPYYTRFGEVYRDGSGSNAPGAAGQLYNVPAPGMGPAPAQPPAGVIENEGPTPAEELPGPTTRMPRGGGSRMTGRNGTMTPQPVYRSTAVPQRTRLFTR
jgi:hypothetical protein